MKKTTKIIIVLLIVIIAGITVVTSMKHAADGPSEVSAEKAAMAYAEAIDYQYENPAVIYEFMTDDFRKVMDKSEFIRAFKKEHNIQGRTYTVSNVYYPDGDSQLAWVRWRTPAEPCVITISVSVYGGGSAQGTITCNIVDLAGNDPPNPLADDRNNAFRLSSIPEKEQVTSASWGIWSPWWQENWEWVENWQKCWHTDRWTDADGKTHRDRWYHWVDNGWWEDHGWWEFDYNGYSASLTASMRITPDEKSPTATASTLKSGYGVQEKVTAKVTTNQSAAVTAAQNAVTYFPEFGYENYWRLLEAEISGRSTTFQFKANPYSTYNRRTHFTPIWYPDGSYTPYTWLLDCWTPTGMLSMNLTDRVTIRGNLWEEWHIAPAKQR